MGEGPGIWTPGGTVPPRRPEPEPETRPDEPTPEQMIEQIRQLKVSDLLVSTMSTLAQIGYVKLEPGRLDLDGARLAIDGLRALIGVVQGSASPDLVRDFGQVIANLQLAYADAASQAPAGEGSTVDPRRD